MQVALNISSFVDLGPSCTELTVWILHAGYREVAFEAILVSAKP
jgi:hypothetical protein